MRNQKIDISITAGLTAAIASAAHEARFLSWATHITLTDLAWGAFATGLASTVASWISLRFTR